MPVQRLLMSWVGHADLRAMAPSLPPAEREALAKVITEGPGDRNGPIKTLLTAETFDEIHLLSNYETRWNKRYAEWLGANPLIHPVKLKDPTDHAAIFQIADAELSKALDRHKANRPELCIHLSPGTPSMAAIWVLLGKTRYPATFYQAYNGRVWRTEIPFDITVDLVPEILREPDSHLLHLAAAKPEEIEGFRDIIGDSKAIRLAVGRARRAALRSVPVLLLGESGTGKEMFAWAIHKASSRRARPFVAVNCAAIPRELLEAELFGYVKGAFTGADQARAGRFKEADGGTIFLDEIGECDAAMQAKLLRVLQPNPDSGPCERVFRPVGATKDESSDVRVIAATNRDLVRDLNEGRFREDLYYRIAVVTVTLAPLRMRRTDVPKITEHLLAKINDEAKGEPGYTHKSLSTGANQFVKQYAWPGNVRQLYNALLQAAVMCDGDTIGRADLKAAVADLPIRGETNPLDLPLGDGFSLEKHLETIQKHYLRRAMAEADGVKTKAAGLLGMKNYQTLDAQLKRLGVESQG